ncbi:MAG: hypothetical protein KBB55_02335 [Candidatus Buchananbacteria bacterium]|nr:hypothetical protein [Candidatus Buchananbacteria bacterium]
MILNLLARLAITGMCSSLTDRVLVLAVTLVTAGAASSRLNLTKRGFLVVFEGAKSELNGFAGRDEVLAAILLALGLATIRVVDLLTPEARFDVTFISYAQV